MNVKISGANVLGEVKAIPSKSYAHRISICNFLAGKTPTANCGQFTSKDITATEQCLKDVAEGKFELDCGESGSTLRFLIPLCASIGGKFSLIGHGKLMGRPNEELFNALKGHGVTAEKTDRIILNGKLTGGEFKIRGDISSQYVSGLLMALPSLKEDSKIVLTTPLASSPYVDITIEVLSNFGVKIEKTDYGFFIKGNQVYSGEVYPEGDWSNSAFFLVLGAISGDVTVSGLNLNSVQGDRAILDILKQSGAQVQCEKNSVRVQKSALSHFTMDAENCPDLVPIASVLGANADGVTVINNVERLKIKESDRIQTTIDMLSRFGVRAESDGHSLKIYGGKAKGCEVDSHNDHRIAMSVAVMATRVEEHTVLTDAKAVEKSYPTFFEDFISVGGRVTNG